MPFRFRALHAFLTYPQCPVPKEIAYDFLTKKFNPLRIIVAHELHEDGQDHLHCYLELPFALDSTDPHVFDLDIMDTLYHGNYQGSRSPKNVIKYCMKGGDYKSSFDTSTTLRAKPVDRRNLAAKLLNTTRRLCDIVKDEEPQLLFGYAKLRVDIDLLQAELRRSVLLPFPVFLPNPWGLVMFYNNRKKKRHYWLYSSMPSVGKTTKFALPLSESFRFVIIAGVTTYWNVTSDVTGIILDDYNSALLKWSELNQMCDGTYGYRAFHRGTIVLSRPLIIVLSNCSLADLYPNRNDLLYARFNEVCLDKYKI